MLQRSAGILLHLSSLPNRFPIGDLGPAATVFVDFMRKSGLRWWQMLPVGPTGEDNSPYQPASAFGGNPLLLSLERLVEQGFLDKKDIVKSAINNEDKVNYRNARHFKIKLLKKAFKNFENKNQALLTSELDAFARAEAAWLDDLALFSAIQENEGTADWTRWEPELRTRKAHAMLHAKKYFAKDIRYYQFVQWQFALQWKAFWAYCNAKGVGLIGDLPLFVAHQSADVWANPEIFKLDAKGRSKVVAGVPPDYFSRTGQIWHMPVYRWDVLKKQHYAWWIQRLQINLQRFDILRLDHFIGLIRHYEIPAQAKTAIKGKYHSTAGVPFFKAVYKALGALPFIAEDLGVVTRKVENLRKRFKLPGTKVLQFELEATLQAEKPPPHNFPIKSVIYTGTHDNDTSKGWYLKRTAAQRKTLCAQLHTSNRDFSWAMVSTALSAKSEIAIIPLQDILGLGSKARMNVPGTSKENWQWRFKKNVLTPDLAQKIRKLTRACKRNNK
jgi:4-alpha-glucanotransferase